MLIKIILTAFTLLLFTKASFAIDNQVKITTDKNYRYIVSNGIPDHKIGQFPNRDNPNKISSQNYNFKVPLDPKIFGKITSLGRHPFGVAINGVVFDPKTAEFWGGAGSGWNYDALSGKINFGLDENKAHVKPNGAYHYHGISENLLKGIYGNPKLVGWAADGFGIYVYDELRKSNYRLKKGKRVGGPPGEHDGSFSADYTYIKDTGDLDECNGKFGVIEEDSEEVYHYLLTDNFPNIPRCLKGEADMSFFSRDRKNPTEENVPEERRAGGYHRHPNLKRAAAKLGIHERDLRDALRPPNKNLKGAASVLGIEEKELRDAFHR